MKRKTLIILGLIALILISNNIFAKGLENQKYINFNKNGKYMSLDLEEESIIIDKRLLVSEDLLKEIIVDININSWENKYEIKRGNKEKIILSIGSNIAYIGDNSFKLDVGPYRDNSEKIYFPFRFIAENLDYDVEWKELSSSIFISENKKIYKILSTTLLLLVYLYVGNTILKYKKRNFENEIEPRYMVLNIFIVMGFLAYIYEIYINIDYIKKVKMRIGSPLVGIIIFSIILYLSDKLYKKHLETLKSETRYLKDEEESKLYILAGNILIFIGLILILKSIYMKNIGAREILIFQIINSILLYYLTISSAWNLYEIGSLKDLQIKRVYLFGYKDSIEVVKLEEKLDSYVVKINSEADNAMNVKENSIIRLNKKSIAWSIEISNGMEDYRYKNSVLYLKEKCKYIISKVINSKKTTIRLAIYGLILIISSIFLLVVFKKSLLIIGTLLIEAIIIGYLIWNIKQV